MEIVEEKKYSVEINNLDYDYGGAKQVLFGVSFNLEYGSRCILLGANGTGKSTLLRIVAGKHMVRDGAIKVLGKNPFHNEPKELSFLGGVWGRITNLAAFHVVPYQADISVAQLLTSAEGREHEDRMKYLIELLDVNVEWRMHEVSDGQRRRVQLLLGLLKPFEVLLLDEVTTDLDVLVRKNLLDFLKRETETRKATILYATHIFDGLNEWASHIVHLANGKVKRSVRVEEISELEKLKQDKASSNSPLLRLVELWIREEAEDKKKHNVKEKSEKEATQPSALIQKFADSRDKGDRFYNYWG